MTVPQKTPQITADYKPLLFLRTSLFCSVLKSILINPSFINLTDIFSIFTLRLSLFDENLHRWKKKKESKQQQRKKKKNKREDTVHPFKYHKWRPLLWKYRYFWKWKWKRCLKFELAWESSTLWHHTILYVCVYLVCLILPHQCP